MAASPGAEIPSAGQARAHRAPAGPLAEPKACRREQRSWYFYDWANSGWLVVVGSLLLGPLLTSKAERSACGFATSATQTCRESVTFGPLGIAAGSVASYTVAVATLAAALMLPLVGLGLDRIGGKRHVLLATAWAGALAGFGAALLPPDAWLGASGLIVLSSVMLAASLVVNDAIMVGIAEPDDRDRVSGTGWALGYLGGLIVLVLSLGWLTRGQSGGAGATAADAGPLEVNQLVALGALWWAGWTVVSWLGLHDRQPDPHTPGLPSGPLAPYAQLRMSFRELRAHRQAMRFLLAYIFYNGGVQSLLAMSSIYASRELGFGATQLVGGLLAVQIVALFGALACTRAAARVGAKSVIMACLMVWAVAPLWAALLPVGQYPAYLLLVCTVGLVLGATQSLSRSLFSRLVPASRVGEFFGIYQASDRATSWTGAVMFGLVYQFTGDYRVAIAGLALFFVIGLPSLARVDVPAGIAQAAGHTAV